MSGTKASDAVTTEQRSANRRGRWKLGMPTMWERQLCIQRVLQSMPGAQASSTAYQKWRSSSSWCRWQLVVPTMWQRQLCDPDSLQSMPCAQAGATVPCATKGSTTSLLSTSCPSGFLHAQWCSSGRSWRELGLSTMSECQFCDSRGLQQVRCAKACSKGSWTSSSCRG